MVENIEHLIIINTMNEKQTGRLKSVSPKQGDFTTYKDFTSDKSLESADFESSFGDIHASFYSSSNEDQANDNLPNFKAMEVPITPRKSKSKEEETNYTTKPQMIIEKEELKQSYWCSNCMLKDPSEPMCSVV